MKNSVCRLRAFACFSLLLLSGALRAQSPAAPVTPALTTTPAPTTAPAVDPVAAADADKPTHYGMRHADFVQLNEAMMAVALDDAEILALDAQVAALLAQREALLVEKTIGKNPALTAKLRTMQQNVSELKRKRDEQKEQLKAFSQGKPQPKVPVAPKS